MNAFTRISLLVMLPIAVILLDSSSTTGLNGINKKNIIIPLNDNKSLMYKWNWSYCLNYQTIKEWAKTYNLELINDNAPYKDNLAWFVSKNGSVIKFDNIKPGNYKLQIDFVKFKGIEKSDITATCKIYCGRILLKELSFSELTDKLKVNIVIKREHFNKKKLIIKFIEFSQSGAFFGVWDVILINLNN